MRWREQKARSNASPRSSVPASTKAGPGRPGVKGTWLERRTVKRHHVTSPRNGVVLDALSYDRKSQCHSFGPRTHTHTHTMSATPQPSSHPTTDTEYQITPAPNHPISSIVFHPNPSNPTVAHQVLVASWDSTVRLYQLPERSVKGAGKAAKQLLSFKHEAPVLDVCWINETMAASGGVDRRVRL